MKRKNQIDMVFFMCSVGHNLSISTSCSNFEAIFENLLGVKAELSTPLGSRTKIIKWLLNRIQTKGHDENRGYAAELLSILLQNNTENRLELGRVDGLEILLKTLSVSSDLHCDGTCHLFID